MGYERERERRGARKREIGLRGLVLKYPAERETNKALPQRPAKTVNVPHGVLSSTRAFWGLNETHPHDGQSAIFRLLIYI